MKIQIDFHGEMGIVKTLNMENAIPLPDINDTVELNMEEFVVEDRKFRFFRRQCSGRDFSYKRIRR